MDAKKINRISAWLLAVGLTAGLAIFVLAKPVRLDPLVGDPMASKRYVRELRVMGGNVNVMMVRLVNWVGDRWHGPQLGVTIAVLTVVGTMTFRFVAARPDLYASDAKFVPESERGGGTAKRPPERPL